MKKFFDTSNSWNKHNVDVGKKCCAFAQFLNSIGKAKFSEKDLDEIHYAGLHHDDGKRFVSFLINKPRKLTKIEKKVVDLHSFFSVVLNDFTELEKMMVLYHHKNPKHAVSEKTQMCIDIIRICDIYDALTQVRPYKRAYTQSEAFAIMADMSLDERMLKLFARMLAEQQTQTA